MRGRQRGRGRESWADSELNVEPYTGFDPRTLGWWTELKSRAGCLTDCATQAPQNLKPFKYAYKEFPFPLSLLSSEGLIVLLSHSYVLGSENNNAIACLFLFHYFPLSLQKSLVRSSRSSTEIFPKEPIPPHTSSLWQIHLLALHTLVGWFTNYKLFLYGPWAKMAFTFYMVVKKLKDE